MLLKLAYLGVTNTFALLRLLPLSDRGKDIEILALRHQIAVLERQLNGQQVRLQAITAASLVPGPPGGAEHHCGAVTRRTSAA